MGNSRLRIQQNGRVVSFGYCKGGLNAGAVGLYTVDGARALAATFTGALKIGFDATDGTGLVASGALEHAASCNGTLIPSASIRAQCVNPRVETDVVASPCVAAR